MPGERREGRRVKGVRPEGDMINTMDAPGHGTTHGTGLFLHGPSPQSPSSLVPEVWVRSVPAQAGFPDIVTVSPAKT